MEIIKSEIAALQQVKAPTEESPQMLSDLQLAAIGGGCGEVLLG